MTPNGIHISLDAKGRLLIETPFRYNEQVRSIPARFSRAKGAWVAPLLRGAIRGIERLKKLPIPITISDDAAEAMANYDADLKIPEERFPPQYKFKTEPMKHQRHALDFCWPRHVSALAMEMGTAKTFIAINTAAARWLAGKIKQVLVLCPSSLVSTWREEIEKHCPVPAHVAYSDVKPPEDRLLFAITTVEGMGISVNRFDEFTAYVRRHPTMAICDESSYIKEQKAARSQRVHLLGGAVPYRMILNGTLIGNNPLDIWSQFEFLDPKIIGQPWQDFRARYTIFGGYNNAQTLGYRDVEELTDIIKPWTFMVKKSEVMKDLPPKLYEKRDVRPSPEQTKLIKAIRGKPLWVDLPELGDQAKIKSEMVLERVLRLRQISSGFISYIEGTPEPGVKLEAKIKRLDSSPKTDELVEVLRQSGEKALVWCCFTEEVQAVTERLAQEFGPQSAVAFYGEMSDEERDAARHRFQDDPTCRYFVGNMAIGGMGLTLTAATLEVYHSNSFSYLQRAQSEDRAHRKGQHNAVTIVDLTMEGTADMLCYNAIVNKKDLAQYVDELIQRGQYEQVKACV